MSEDNSSEPEESAIEEFTQLIEDFAEFMKHAERFEYGEIRRRKTRYLIAIRGLEAEVIREGMVKGSSFEEMREATHQALLLCAKINDKHSRRIYTVKQGGTPEHVENLKEDLREMIRQNRDELEKQKEMARQEREILLQVKAPKGSRLRKQIDARLVALNALLLEVVHHSEDTI